GPGRRRAARHAKDESSDPRSSWRTALPYGRDRGAGGREQLEDRRRRGTRTPFGIPRPAHWKDQRVHLFQFLCDQDAYDRGRRDDHDGKSGRRGSNPADAFARHRTRCVETLPERRVLALRSARSRIQVQLNGFSVRHGTGAASKVRQDAGGAREDRPAIQRSLRVFGRTGNSRSHSGPQNFMALVYPAASAGSPVPRPGRVHSQLEREGYRLQRAFHSIALATVLPACFGVQSRRFAKCRETVQRLLVSSYFPRHERRGNRIRHSVRAGYGPEVANSSHRCCLFPDCLAKTGKQIEPFSRIQRKREFLQAFTRDVASGYWMLFPRLQACWCCRLYSF